MKVLVINAGSSSLKYQLFDMDNESVAAKGICERIAVAPGSGLLTHTPGDKPKIKKEIPMATHADAMQVVLESLTDGEVGVIGSLGEIDAIGHRVVSGGPKYSESALLTDEVMRDIEAYIPLVPLHNPANLEGIKACLAVMPNVPQVATFDTSFHQTMPEHAYIYAIPYEYYTKYNIRRYGFHGTSHRFVSEQAIELLGGKAEGTRIITCHLGNGSSLAAIKDGKCIDTSMGLTPLEGVPMGTRSGSIDPALIEFIANIEDLPTDEAFKILQQKSGVLGISGVSSDFRDIEIAAVDETDPVRAHRSQLALDIFHYNVAKFAASYYAILGGADALVYTAGLGENSDLTRGEIAKHLGALGISIDAEKNKVRGKFADITGKDSKTKVFIIPTNEELVIARDTVALVK